ncbi:lantibiotic dehydratase [Streptomyces sp. NPDC048191]|uniref:lantibiotic dehydratase n=1 Tax=Streptomyces sp. NPDC048191 TaxID=3155484 RepID=UPI0033FD7BAE
MTVQQTGLLPSPVTPAPATPALEPLWVLRVNPLRRTRLADPGLAALLGELRSAESDVAAAADRCSDDLHELIGATTDREARGRLIALRRDIHNDRRSRGDASATPAVSRWAEARDRRDALRRQVADAYPEAVDRERRRLGALLADDDLRRALALVAPDVADGAERYRAALTGPGPLSARLRKSERGLVQYVTRAMIRTSPLSRFTAVGVAVPDRDGLPPEQARLAGGVPFMGLDRVMLGYVLSGLTAPQETVGPGSWVQLPPTAEHDEAGARLYFLRPAPSGIRRLSTPVTGLLQAMLEATAVGPRRAGDVAGHLAARAGLAPEQALGAVAQAVGAGILCTCDGPEDGDAPYARLLDRPTSPAAGLLDDVGRRLSAVTDAVPERRGAELAGLKAALADVSRHAGRPAQILVEEDYVLPPQRLATGAWRERLDDLAAGVELLSVFDRLHDVRALMSAAFVERFGSGAEVPLAEHAAYLVAEVYRRGGAVDGTVPPGTGPADGSLDALQRLRRRVLDELHADMDRHRPGDGDLVWSPDRARALAAHLPERYRAAPLAHSVLVQAWNGHLLFNDAYAGHGMLYGRFLGPDRELGGGALAHLAERLRRQYGADGHRLTEDLGLHRLNVNAHAPVLADGLRPEDWFTFRLAHDPDTDALHVLDGDGRPTRVLTLGAGHPELFPPPVRVATWLISGGRLMEDLVAGRYATTGTDPTTTRSCPRLRVGSAVLARRRWYGGRDMAEAVAAGPDEHDRLTALTKWRARHGIPAEIVLKTPMDDDYRREAVASGEDVQAHRQRQKPQYVDLESALSVRVLPRLLERRSPGYLEEALPGAGDGPHATEWVVEIHRPAGGTFQYGGIPE